MSRQRQRYPRGHTFSPSVMRTMAMCELRHWFKKIARVPDPPGPQARVGTLVHSVLEHAALKRLEPVAGAEPVPDEASADELLGILQVELDGEGAWVVTAARECVEAAAPMSFEHTTAAEGIIDRFPIAEDYTVGGIVDRVDRWQDEEGQAHAVITDYKTGFVPPADELAESEQTTCYLAWGAETFDIHDENLVLVYHWPGEDIRIAIRYDADLVSIGVGNLVRRWKKWEAGGYSKEKQAPATLGVHCSHCPAREQCTDYQEHIRKPARVHPWAGLEMSELAELRHQVSGDAKMLETARKELDQHIIAVLKEGGDDRFADDEYALKIQRDTLTSYTMGAVDALAQASGLELEDVMRAVCSVSTSKVRAFVKKHRAEAPRVERVARVYETPSMKSPYVRCRAKGGLF